MHVFNTRKGIVVQHEGAAYLLNQGWDALVNRDELHGYLLAAIGEGVKLTAETAMGYCDGEALPPVGTQEVWAAGVTYLRSRDARMEESKISGGADFYDKVYMAERPELFFKSLSHRVAGHGQPVYIRRDSTWNVPEPELTLYINAHGRIQGYTVGNDMSSRSIEGENPLYLPQAKTYERSAALGPCLYVPVRPLSPETGIHMQIFRSGVEREVYKGSVEIARMKRGLEELVGYLYRELRFEVGCYLMTGTCLVPPNDFTLQEDDQVDISIDGIGVLRNRVAYGPRP